MTLGPLTFLHPLALWGLLALPLIWWVLKITPPKPVRQTFPPLRLLADIKREEDTPNATPLWLLLFRLGLGALLTIALAGPVLFKPDTKASKDIVLVIDNGWAGAENWSQIHREAEAIIRQAISDQRQVALAPAIDGAEPAKFLPARQALKFLQTLGPAPLEPARKQMVESLSKPEFDKAEIDWLSDGLDYGQAQSLGPLIRKSGGKLYLPAPEDSPVFFGKTDEIADGFVSLWHRLDSKSARHFTVTALDAKGLVVGNAALDFAPGTKSAEARFKLPSALRNRVARIKIDRLASAGTTRLMDDSWGRPLVGLLKGSDENIQPLLSEWHYIEEALKPKADIYKGDLDELLAVSPSIIFMTDRARSHDKRLKKYVENGGLLIRFAGPKLAKRPDALLPVRLRAGGRHIGGALAWETPQGLAPFERDSPFFGLPLKDDIIVSKQVLAEPGAETDTHSWARLKDGSPIITSAPLKAGRIVLFHVTAGPDWSNLPLSGLYVKMLDRLLPLAGHTSRRTQTTSQGDWTAEQILDGFGTLKSPPANLSSIPDKIFSTVKPDAKHPPGLYKQGLRHQALNAIWQQEHYQLLKPDGMKQARYGGRKPKSLVGILLGLFGGLLILDVFLSLLASGRLRRTTALALIIGFIVIPAVAPPNAQAQQASETQTKNGPGWHDALNLHLAYIKTGDFDTDRMSRIGLQGLAFELDRRTTIEPKGVRAIDINSDPLDFYPFLYWPVPRDLKPLSPKAVDKLNAFMASGGILVLDTRDQDRRRLFKDEVHAGLAQLSKQLDIPRLTTPKLTPVQKAHVLTKSFYLIHDFPGRWADGQLWVEASQKGSARDGVSSVIVGSNDWASAWAKDDKGRALSVIENEIPRQREMAIRFGINMAMYALTGNYKGDQVHAAKLVERLGEQPDQRELPADPPQPEAPK